MTTIDINKRNKHDLFNLIFLIPLNLCNILNWKLDGYKIVFSNNFFDIFKILYYFYFVIDTIWILLIPSCVKSAKYLYIHHILGLISLFLMPKNGIIREYTCITLLTEINTLFLIARRLFNCGYFIKYNKYNQIGTILNTKIKIASIGFYISWLIIRLGIMPYLSICLFYFSYKNNKKINILAFLFHSIFTLLGIKWTIDFILLKKKNNKK